MPPEIYPQSSHQTLIKYLSLAVITLSFCTLALCFFFPTYVDEIVWKAVDSRYWYDGGRAMSLTVQPHCLSYSSAVPFYLVPSRWFYSWLYSNLTTPLSYRIFGIIVAGLWMCISWRMLSRLFSPSLSSKTVGICLVAFSTLGVMPFWIIISRPEQLMLLCITLLFIPLLLPKSDTPLSLKQSIINITCILLLCYLAMNIHPKFLFALPLIYLALIRNSSKPWLMLVSLLICSIYAILVYHNWSLRWSCPGGGSYLKNMLSQINLGFAITDHTAFKNYLNSFLSKSLDPAMWYISPALFIKQYTSNILPAYSDTYALSIGMLIGLFLLASILSGVICYMYALSKRWKEKKYRISLLSVASLWLFYLACVTSRLDKNAYEAGLILPILAFIVISSYWLAWPILVKNIGNKIFLTTIRFFYIALLLLSFLSQLIVFYNYTPLAFESWRLPGYINQQAYSSSSFSFSSDREKIIRVAKRCNIDFTKNQYHLVVDNLSYFVFQQSYQPFFIAYLDENSWSKDQPDPSIILKKYHSSGMIAACHLIPSALKSRAIQDGDFCCLPKFS